MTVRNDDNDMRLAGFIAGRYLIAKKSHNVINIISAISAIGMAIGTAALIIILSVYNGFDSLIKSMMSNVEPDLLIASDNSKAFIPEGEAYDWIYEQESVKNMSCIVQENVFISYNGQQTLAKAKGVDHIYEEESPIADHMINGTFSLHFGDVPKAVVGAELAAQLGINPRFLSGIEIYFPSRTRNISMANPAASIEAIKVWPEGTFMINGEIDKDLIILPIEEMRELLEYTDEVTAVEVRMVDGSDTKELRRLQEGIEERLGPGFAVKDRFQQNEVLYKMMKYEKAAIYLILFFVIIIIAFSIFGSLSMLIIEKKDDIRTLRSMGADNKLIRRIFVFEGWMISLVGMAGGLILGIGFTMLQQHLGFIRMPGHFTVQAYPVILSWSDILLTAAGVAAIGYLIALLPVSYYSKKNSAED